MPSCALLTCLLAGCLALPAALTLVTSVAAEPTAAPASPSAPASAGQAATSPRAPDAEERTAMLEILKAESAPERAAWLTYGAGDAESKALADARGAVFREAGWKVDSTPLTGMVLKPGVSLLFAESEPPAWTESVLRAMQASGIAHKSATGYRPYYEEKKAENPAWPGVPIGAEQAYVLVLGPAPDA